MALSFNHEIQVRQLGQRNLSEVSDRPSGLPGANQIQPQPCHETDALMPAHFQA